VAISPNGQLLATSEGRGALKLWDLTTRSEFAVIRERGLGGFGLRAFVFSNDGSRLAAVFPGAVPGSELR